MSAENVAIVKSSWAGWRQGLRPQMERDLDDGIADRIDRWANRAGIVGWDVYEKEAKARKAAGIPS